MLKNWTLIVTVVLLSTYFVSAQNPTTIALANANQMIKEKQYLSAFNYLHANDPENQNIALVSAKYNLVKQYFIVSIMHEMFSLKDLEEEEDIKDLRGQQGESITVDFNPRKALESLLKQFPDKIGLHYDLADYYFDVHLTYNYEWLMPVEQQLKKIKHHNSFLLGTNLETAKTHYAIAYVALVDGGLNDAIKSFKTCLKMDSLYTEAYYNMAYAYLYNNVKDSCLINAQIAFKLYDSPNSKADAARMIAVVYDEQNNQQAAKKYYKIACNLQPNNYYNVGPLLDIYVRENLAMADSLRLAFFNIDPTEPTIYNDLGDIYNYYKKSNELTGFYEYQLTQHNDNLILANLHFYLAQQYLETDLKVAAEAFNRANKLFALIFEPEHPVFKVIQDALKMTAPIYQDKP